MNKMISLLKGGALVLVLSTFGNISVANAMVEDLGLCPDGFSQGLVTTGFVDCDRRSSSRSDIEEAELDRLDREAVCLANPNSQVQSSEIVGDSNGRFYARITCRVDRPVAPGTVLCPDNSTEVYRAYDTLACQYFGMASTTAAGAQAMLNEQSSDCASNFGGRALLSSVKMESSDANDPPTDFFRTSFACAKEIAPLDVFECPLGFDQTNQSNDDMLVCEYEEDGFETQAEANAVKTQVEAICTTTTANLGVVSESRAFASTSGGSDFLIEMVCTVAIPRFGDFADDSIARACDASCTESVVQTRPCLNGGVVGGPGCTLPASQTVERRCNTGPDRTGLCPLVVAPATAITPLLLLDEDEPPMAGGDSESN